QQRGIHPDVRLGMLAVADRPCPAQHDPADAVLSPDRQSLYGTEGGFRPAFRCDGRPPALAADGARRRRGRAVGGPIRPRPRSGIRIPLLPVLTPCAPPATS